MSATRQKNFRFSPDVCDILDSIVSATGTNDSRIAELAISLYGLELGVEIDRAKQFLYNNLAARVAAHRMHAPGLPASARLSAKDFIAAAAAARSASYRMHQPRSPAPKPARKGALK